MELRMDGIGPVALLVCALMMLPRMAMPQDAGNVLGGGGALNAGSGSIQRVQVQPEAEETAELSAEERAEQEAAAAQLQQMIESDPALKAMQQALEEGGEGAGPAAMERALMQALDGGRPPAQLSEDAGLIETMRVIGEERDAAMRRAAAFGQMMGEMQDAEGAKARAAREAAAAAKANRPPTLAESLFAEYGRAPQARAPIEVTREAIGVAIEQAEAAPLPAADPAPAPTASEAAPIEVASAAPQAGDASLRWPRPNAAQLEAMKVEARKVYETGQPLSK